MFYNTLLFIFGLTGVFSSTNVVHIQTNNKYMLIYMGDQHSIATRGTDNSGIVIMGGEFGNMDDMDDTGNSLCSVPYNDYPSNVDTGEVPCGITSVNDTWTCGKKFTGLSGGLITHNQFSRLVHNPNYRKFGEYDVSIDENTLWNVVVVPISKFDTNTKYAITTTANNCYDRPTMNAWINFEIGLVNDENIDANAVVVVPVPEKKYRTQIELSELQNLAQRMEDNGMFGVEEYIDQIIMEVLIAKTNVFNKDIIKLIKPSKGIILYGPPGTGKTTLAKNLALILGDGDSEKVKMITSTEILSKWHGQSEENVRALFDDAIKANAELGDESPLYFLIIDEIDAVLSHRGESAGNSVHDPIVNQFLGLMDGLVDCSNLIVIGITNRLDRLDNACLRPGRFGCKISIDLPTHTQRTRIWQNYYQKVFDAGIIDKVNCAKLSKMSDKFTGADIEYIFDTSIKQYIMNVLSNKEKNITEYDLVKLVIKYKQ